MIEIALTTFGAVLVAEIAGDKLLYTTGVLAVRYRSAAVATGMALAFMCKMAVAVALGAAITRLEMLGVLVAQSSRHEPKPGRPGRRFLEASF